MQGGGFMTYFEAIRIKQDLIVKMQYAEAFHKTPVEALKEAASKYTNEQFAEAYKVICAKLNEDKEDLKKLLRLAAQSKMINNKQGNKNDS
jgi:hypothetical protein